MSLRDTQPFVCCADCKVPLVMTFKFPGKEWICVQCRKVTAFFDSGHVNLPWTEERKVEFEELLRKWQEENE